MIKVLEFLREALLNLLIPLLYLVYVILVIKSGNWLLLLHPSFLEIILMLFLIFGLGLWLISYFYLYPSTYLYPRANQLVTTGPYRFIRHPVYLGVLIVFFSLSLLTKSWLALGYTLLIILPLNFGRTKWEEKILTEIFGEKYRRYQRQTLF